MSLTKVDSTMINELQQTITVTGTNWTTDFASAIYYKTANGNHRLRFMINGHFSSAVTSGILTFGNGIISSRTQAIACINGASNWTRGHATGTNLQMEGGTAHASWFTSGEIELDAKPTNW